MLDPDNVRRSALRAATIRGSFGAMASSDSILPVRPLPFDSDVLMRNIVREVRPGLPPTKLLNHLRLGTVRPFIAMHQVAEVRRHISRVAAESGVDPVAAGRMFEAVYVPLLWQVDVAGLPLDDALVHQVVCADAADADTARLAVLLGLRVVTANKAHFKEVAILNDWLTVVAAYADACVLDGANAGVMFSVRVSGEGIAAAANGLQSGIEYLADHPRVAIGLGIGLLVIIVLGLIVFSDEDRRQRVREFVKDAGQFSGQLLAEAAARYANAIEAAADAEPVVTAVALNTGTPSLVQSIARRLACSRWPLPIESVVAAFPGYGRKALLRTLEAYPAFVRTEDGWVLGSRSAAKLAG